MSTLWSAGAAAGICVIFAASPSAAHHSIQSVVDTSRTLQSEMVLTRVDWVNPHAWFHFALSNSDGATAKDVAVEWMGLAGLRQQGYTGPDAFPAGHTYRVTYFPNRDGSPGGNLVTMTDQDTGRVYGRGAPPPRPPVAPPAAPGARLPVTNISY